MSEHEKSRRDCSEDLDGDADTLEELLGEIYCLETNASAAHVLKLVEELAARKQIILNINILGPESTIFNIGTSIMKPSSKSIGITIKDSQGVQVAADGAHARTGDIAVKQTITTASEDLLTQEIWKNDIQRMIEVLAGQVGVLEDELWQKSMIIFSRLHSMDVDGKRAEDVREFVNATLGDDERGVLNEATHSLRSVAENLAASVVWWTLTNL